MFVAQGRELHAFKKHAPLIDVTCKPDISHFLGFFASLDGFFLSPRSFDGLTRNRLYYSWGSTEPHLNLASAFLLARVNLCPWLDIIMRMTTFLKQSYFGLPTAVPSKLAWLSEKIKRFGMILHCWRLTWRYTCLLSVPKDSDAVVWT